MLGNHPSSPLEWTAEDTSGRGGRAKSPRQNDQALIPELPNHSNSLFGHYGAMAFLGEDATCMPNHTREGTHNRTKYTGAKRIQRQLPHSNSPQHAHQFITAGSTLHSLQVPFSDSGQTLFQEAHFLPLLSVIPQVFFHLLFPFLGLLI